MTPSLLIAFLALALPDDPASLIEQLSSPVQETRDAAAERLRAVYKPTPREHWTPVVAKIKVGDTKPQVIERLKQAMAEAKAEMGVGTGATHMECYRSDDRWLAQCWFANAGDLLREITLVERTRHIWVEPPPEFSGVWTVYFASGHQSHEIHYRRGKYFGEFTAFHPGGGKSYVQHYVDSVIDGEDTGYFPSGRISYRAFYRSGVPTGTWTWYAEDGTVRNTEEKGK